jgi:mono/diheme cytochrome c family protein/cytochrome c2
MKRLLWLVLFVPQSQENPYHEAFTKLGKTPNKEAKGCVACHQGMNDVSLITLKVGDELRFRDSEIQDRAVKAFPDVKVRQSMIHTFMAHPKPDIIFDKHASFRCETCHVYDDRKTDPILSPERKKYWIEHHMKYHPIQKDIPMRLTYRLQAMCLKCHMGEEPLPGADMINRGKTLYQATACNTCHNTYGMKILDADLVPGEKRMRRPGPPLEFISSKIDKKWMFNWVAYPPSFKPSARMPPIFPRGSIVGKLPPEIAPETIPKDKIGAYEQVLIAAAVEYIFSISKPIEMDDIPAGILETEDWKIEDQKVRGQILVQDRGCLGCHRIDENYPPNFKDTTIYLEDEFATNLFGSGDKFDSPLGRKWLYNWLKKPSHYSADTPMPEFGFSEQERGDILQFLLSLKIDNEARKSRGLKPWIPHDPPQDEKILNELIAHQKGPVDAPLRDKWLWEGKKVVEVFTCYSCHKMGGDWDSKPVVWGTLSHDLLPPRQIMSRMPLFELNSAESNLMVTYLWGAIEGCGEKKHQPSEYRKAIAEGERILAKYNCQGCHVMEGVKLYVADENKIVSGEVQFKRRVERTEKLNRPQWAVEWLRDGPTLDFPPIQKKYPQLVPSHLIERFDPLRGGTYIARRMPLATEEEKATIGTRMPPSLRTVGRKLDPEWLKAFLRQPDRLRPVDGPQMPRFNFEPGEIDALVDYFRYRDGAVVEDGRLKPEQIEARYAELLKADQLLYSACAQCHKMDGQGGPYSVDLAITYRRLNRSWLSVFMSDPGSIYPGTAMPQPPKEVPVEDIVDVLHNYSQFRVAKVRRGGAKEILEALRTPHEDVKPLVALAVKRVVDDPSLEDVLRHVVSIGGSPDLEPLLSSPNAAIRAMAIDGLTRVGARESIEKIASRLSDGDAPVRRAALVAIGYFKAAKFAKDVAGLLSDPDSSTRTVAIEALRELDAENAAIVPLVKDPDPIVRRTAVESLGLPHAAVVAEALKDPELGVRVSAAEALADLGARDQIKALLDVEPNPAVLVALSRLGHVPQDVGKLLEHGDASIRMAAAVCLLASDPKPFKELLQQRPFDKATVRVVQEGLNALNPNREKAAAPGTQTVEAWLAALGATTEDREKLKTMVTLRGKTVGDLMRSITRRTGLVFVTKDDKLTLVPLERAVDKVLE